MLVRETEGLAEFPTGWWLVVGGLWSSAVEQNA